MKKAYQELKSRSIKKGGFLLLAAAIGLTGFISYDRVSSLDNMSGTQNEPKVTQIQKQPPVTMYLPLQKATVKTESKNRYMVKPGDTYWEIAKKFKPSNVLIDDYVIVLKNVNLNGTLQNNQYIHIPTKKDLANVILTEVTVNVDITDSAMIEHLKEAEGSMTAQSKLKRKLLGGGYGPSFKNNKFYPYKDINGNYTIGYGHHLGKKDSDARKFRTGITESQAHSLLIADMKRIHNDFILLLQKKSATNLSEQQQRILYEMCFTMGVDKLNSFNRLWKSVENGNGRKFKKEIQNSLWYKQVRNRADILMSSL